MDATEQKISQEKINQDASEGKSLKQQTIFSLLWNAFDKIGFQLIAFIIGLITLRMLSPEDFGLMGALAIFTALSNILVESGFTSAMVRRKKNTEGEYTAIFLFNISLSLTFYLVLYGCAGLIADWYQMEQLTDLARFLFLCILFNSLGIVQNIILTKNLAFKKLSIANMTGALTAGVVTLILILHGFSYWALAWQILLQSSIKCLMLWFFSDWRPKEKPDFRIIREVFLFSFSLILASLLNTFIRYIYNPIIGRRYGEEELGYYSEAYKFFFLPSNIVSNTISGVSYPVLSQLNDEPQRQLTYLRKLVKMTAFGIFPILLGAMACFDNVVSCVLTSKWAPIVPYFQILAIAGTFIAFHTLYLGVITLKGHPKKNFAMELIRNLLILLPLAFLYTDIRWMLWGFTIANVISYLADTLFMSKVMNYRIIDQIKDIAPYIGLSLCMAATVYFVGISFAGRLASHWTLLLQIISGITVYIGGCHLFGSTIVKEISGILLKKKR